MFCKPCETSIDKARQFFENAAMALDTTPSPTEVRKLIGQAFGGKTIDKAADFTKVMLKPMNVSSREKTKDRQELAAYSLGFFLHEQLSKGGMAVGLRGHDDGLLKAVVVFREYNVARDAREPNALSRITDFVENIKAYMSMSKDSLGIPSILLDKEKKRVFEDSSKHFQHLEHEMRNWHIEYGPQKTHWYVAIVASHPETQGKGYCKQLMQQFCRAADECNMTCYLECGNSKRTYYEKFGFQVQKSVSIRLDNVEIPGALMTRHCTKQNDPFV